MEALACQDLAVPAEVMHHIVRVESSYNPYAIGVVGTRLARQPRNLAEAIATARQLERDGFNFSLGLAQVNLHNLAKQGLADYALAFDPCPNLVAGSRILADCHVRAGGDWDKAFSCYYSGNFSTGFRDGYVRKIRASIARDAAAPAALAIAVAAPPSPPRRPGNDSPAQPHRQSLAGRRGASAPGAVEPGAQAVPPPPVSTSQPAVATAADLSVAAPAGRDTALVF
ncbi:lytic transglycosylase domain-containing protein [Luteimonas sp. MC1825]|nr:lytic transglycosylase domain-containing protein [Luteimonas sp. MC1782]MBB6599815.1 lytic transglycosylase domain-containing protein [Luteimonas sp. MC1825]QOC89561.1 lytic transglycosylase domain-containing protein [Luteimonas sp. MC1825]